MTTLQELSLSCTKEALTHDRHTNVSVEVLSADIVYIVSPELISLSFVSDGSIVSDTIINNKNSSHEELILDYIYGY